MFDDLMSVLHNSCGNINYVIHDPELNTPETTTTTVNPRGDSSKYSASVVLLTIAILSCLI